MKTDIEETEIHSSDLTGFITYRIARVNPKLNAQASHILRQHAGLSLVQWRIIALIRTFGPNISSRELVDPVGMDKGLFSRSLKTLMQSGHVVGAPDKADMRRTLLSLSQEGEAVYDRTIKTMRRRQEHLLHDLSDEEHAALTKALAKLEKNAERRDF